MASSYNIKKYVYLYHEINEIGLSLTGSVELTELFCSPILVLARKRRLMDIMQAIKERHSVRAFTDEPLSPETILQLKQEIGTCNAQSGLHMQLVVDEPEAFDCRMAKYGKFSGVRNYLALIGPKGSNLDEDCGYYGERIVLLAQQLGLNSCWVGMTYQKVTDAYQINDGEKLTAVIALGYGETQGKPHKTKGLEDVSPDISQAPDWFKRGVEAALLAPTAVNQQKFVFTYEGDNRVHAKHGLGFYAKMDLGIARYHFECGAAPQKVMWV